MNFSFALLAAVTPLYVTHNNVPGNTPTMTNMQAWAESIGGGGGITEAQAGTIATNTVDAKVAPWAMSGQPKPTTDLTGMTNFVRGVAQSGTNYTDTAKSQAISSAASSAAALYYRKDGGDISGNVRITKDSTTTLTIGNTANETHNATSPYETVFDSYGNITIKSYYGGTYEMNFPLKSGALMVDSDVPSWAKAATKPTYTAAEVGAATPAQLVAATNATLIAAKAYADGKFLPTSGGTMENGARLQMGDSGYLQGDDFPYLYLYFPKYKFGSPSFYQGSDLIPDGTPVVTSNMLNGVLMPAIAQKANRAVRSTEGDFASLTAQGNLQDSGKKAADFAPAGTYLKQDGSVYADYLNIKGHAPNYNTGGFYIEHDVQTDEYYMYVMIPSKILFHDWNHNQSELIPDNTPVMTEGQADYHIIYDDTVTSGQIGNFDLTDLTAKTVSCSVSETSGKASDILIWTYGNTAECQMTFTLPSGFTLVGDAADTKASANKKCLFSLVKISNTEVIVSKKEYN